MNFATLHSVNPTVDDVAALTNENQRLRALLDFSREVTAERDLSAQLRLLCAEVARTTGCPAAAVVLRDPEMDVVEAVESVGLPLATELDWQQSARATRGAAAELAPPAGFEPLAALPLAVGDERLGVALAFDSVPRDLVDAERICLTQVVDAAAMAILNARLHAQNHLELRRRDALRRVVASISSELDQDSLFGRVIAGAVELLDTDGGVIGLIDQDGTMRIRAVHNLPEAIVGREVALGEALTGRWESESGVAVPVWWQDRMIGVFGVLAHDRSRVFSAQDREIMELLASHVAIALDNARLYGEVRDRLAEVTGLQAASTALAEELHPERALRVLAEQALLLSGAATVSIELLRPNGRELEVQVAVGESAVELAAMRVDV
ncbi:MAG TPA: GAF domain-containing protein, partial [Chloroflexota bacterium]